MMNLKIFFTLMTAYSIFALLIIFAAPDLFLEITAGVLLMYASAYMILRPDLSLPYRDSVSRSGDFMGDEDGHKAKIGKDG